MSEASRAAALAHAALVHQGSGDAIGTLETAEAFHSFIGGGENAKVAPPAKTAAPVKAAAPAKPAKKAAPPVVEEDEEEEAPEAAEEGVTKEEAGEAIEALLNANLRDKALKIFAKYKAKSLGGVKPSDYAALKQDAEDALLNS